MNHYLRGARWLLACTWVAIIGGCGGGGGNTPQASDQGGGGSPASDYTLGGNLIGLANGKSLVLENGGSQLTVTAAGSFSFTPKFTNGSNYVVTVATQPSGQFCNVGNGSGTIQGANVTSINVVCAQVLAGGSGTLQISGGTVSTAAIDVTAPAAATIDIQSVTVSTVPPPNGLPVELMPLGAAVDVAVSKPQSLNAPFLLTLRYDPNAVVNEDDLAVVHYNPTTQRYEPVTVLSQDLTTHSFTFEARSFSPFVVVSYISSALASSFSVPGFTPANNGWNIANFGSYYSANGNCLGMAGYATWFFGNRSDKLSTKYSATGDPSIAQLVSARAQMAQSQYWAAKSDTYLRSLGNAATARLMRLYLSLFKQPLILTLTGSRGGHASVVYGYDANGFAFYDVNVPNQSQTLSFDGASWGTYDGYTDFGFVALPSLGRTEDFEQLTVQAEEGFSSSSQINITSPTRGQNIATHSVTLTGTLSGALNSNASMVAYVKGVPQLVAASTGAFSSTLPISAGENTIILFAGTDLAKQSNWFLNAATLILSVNGTVPQATLLATLAWDQSDSDVDLYVVEPLLSGQAAWYSNKITTNRLALDFDNTSGFGPEHVTLTTSGVNSGVALPGLYKIRVHYYSDHGAGPTVSGTVSVLINEGQPSQRIVTRRFTLSSPNSDNDSPASTGADWADIATVDLENATIR